MEAAASAGQLKEVIPPLHRKSRCAEKKWSLSAGHAEGRKNGNAGCGSVLDMVVQTKSFKYLNQPAGRGGPDQEPCLNLCQIHAVIRVDRNFPGRGHELESVRHTDP